MPEGVGYPQGGPFDLTATLTRPQTGPAAAPKVVRSGASPFEEAGRTTGSDRLRAFGAGMAGMPGFLNTLADEKRQRKMGVAQQILADRIQMLKAEGLNANQILQGVLNSEEFVQTVAELPAQEIFDFVTTMAAGIAAPPPKTETLSAGESIVRTGPDGRVEEVHRNPTATQQDIEAVVRAEKSGDKRTAKLLIQRLMGKDGNGETSVTDALKLRVAGVGNTGNGIVNKMSSEQAGRALTYGKGSETTSMSITSVIGRALGLETGNPNVDKLSPEEAEAMANAYKDQRGNEDFIQALFGALGKRGDLPEGVGGQRKPLSEYREELRRSKGQVKTRDFGNMDDSELRAFAQRVLDGEEELTAQERKDLVAELRARK